MALLIFWEAVCANAYRESQEGTCVIIECEKKYSSEISTHAAKYVIIEDMSTKTGQERQLDSCSAPDEHLSSCLSCHVLFWYSVITMNMYTQRAQQNVLLKISHDVYRILLTVRTTYSSTFLFFFYSAALGDTIEAI